MPNLLPKTSSDFASKDYWDRFFNQLCSPFEWYGEYRQLSRIFSLYANPIKRTLIVGCGNSSLSYDLDTNGYKNVVSIDISDVAIKQMKEKYPELDFRQMDASQLDFADDEFNVVIDKGTIDALLPNLSGESVSMVNKLLAEVSRCLHKGGRFICVTLLQDHVAKTLFDFFIRASDNFSWVVRVHRCFEAEDTRRELVLPVYVVIAIKRPSMAAQSCVFEMCSSTLVRYASAEALLAELKLQQNYAFFRNHLCRFTLDREYKTELYSTREDVAKYELFIVDTPDADRQTGLKFACFIVPEGRECEWLFGTPKGRKILAKQCQAHRVVFVHLSRHFKYASTKQIEDELSHYISQLTPKNFKQGAQIPFLSVGEAAGTRKMMEKGHSAISGDFIVEDVTIDDKIYRRLLFLDRPSVIQTEMRVHKKTVDHSHLSSEYYKYMVVALGFFGSGPGAALLLGLGGGTLASYVAKYAKWSVQAVELDEEIIGVAHRQFKLFKTVKTECGDALEFVKTSTNKFDIIWLDIDSKDVAESLTCPPEAFLHDGFLSDATSLLSAKGVFVMNLACRDEMKCKDVYRILKNKFSHVKVANVSEDINQVIYASNGNSLECNVKELRSLLRQSNRDNDIECIEQMLQGVKL
ncbi:methyltransferase protein 13-like [Tropilaelaps mercedesae]|uniref:Methyltransferase protein 13-like n=1 Tax=Tropilaelaps mercedesae TaxID=418985 RepID=A0A1V9XZ34_9ACAR|nr:methyltransferase protein 13-like [Tropilaelaps mercedesae]